METIENNINNYEDENKLEVLNYFSEINKLNKEMNLLNLDEINKVHIRNIFKSWTICKNNFIIISNIENCDIIVDNNCILINYEVYRRNINKKIRILFSNCKNLNILIFQKLNHILFEKCSNIKIKITAGIIGGIDVINCDNINFHITKKDIFYISYGDSNICTTCIDKDISLNTQVLANNCNEINLLLMSNSSMFSTNII